MSTCTTCYGTNTAQPCASVGCLSTNYAKCITYSGSNLFCQQGSIGTFTFTGTAVSSPTDVTVVASATGGNGTSSTFTVIRRAGQTTYEVTIANEGGGYEVSDVLTIPGNLLGGATPANDITITVTALTPVISFGNNLDEVIVNINNRLCLISQESPSGLDYTSFNYACLRVGGNLESVGTPITTAKQFTEAVASALCSLNIRVKDVEKPQIIVDTYFGGDIISGTSTLVQILNKYGEAIGDLNDKFTINSPHTCGTFTHLTNLTAKPSPTASLGTWFDWVSTNLCNNFTILDAKITEQINEHTLINTFLYGVNQPYPVSRGNNFVNTLCLTGGVAQSNIRTAVNLLVTELCSLKTTVTNASTQNYTVTPVTCLNTPFPSNSVFGNNSNLAPVLGTTTLQGHLNQIYNVLSNLNIKFSSTDFEFVTPIGSCGPEIRLKSGAAGSVTCAAVEANVDLSCLRDAYYTNLNPDTSSILVRDNGTPRQWRNAGLRLLTYTISGVDTSFGTYTSTGAGTLDIQQSFPKSQTEYLSPHPDVLPSSSAIGFIVQPSGFTSGVSGYPLMMLDKITGIAGFYKDTSFTLNNSSGSTITITDGTEINIFTASNLIFLPDIAPNNGRDQLTTVTGIRRFTSGGGSTFVGTSTFVLKVISQSNATVVSPGIYKAISVVYQGPSLNVLAGQYFDFHVGGISWNVI